MLKYLLSFLSAVSLFGQTAHLATTDDGSVLYFASTLRRPGAGQSMASKLFRIDSTGAHLIDDEGNVAIGAAYWDLSSPSTSSDGSRLVYTARQFCNTGDICAYGEWSTPRTPPGARSLFLPMDAGGVAISRNGRYAALYGTAVVTPALTSTVVLIDLATGTRSHLPAFGSAQVTSSGKVLAAIKNPSGSNVVLALFAPDGTFTVLNALTISDDGSVIVYRDSKSGELFASGTSAGQAIPIGPAGQINAQPLLSKNGSRVILLSGTSPGTTQLFYSRTDGTGLRQLTNAAEGISEAILSGDGTVAYAMTNGGALLKIDTATANSTQLVAPFPLGVTIGVVAPGSLVIAGGFSTPLPTAVGSPSYSAPLAGLTVTVEDLPAPLLLVSPTEIQFQIPWEATLSSIETDIVALRPEPMGPAVVLPGAGPIFEAAFPLNVQATFPQILALAAPGGYFPVAIHQDGVTLVTFSQPAM